MALVLLWLPSCSFWTVVPSSPPPVYALTEARLRPLPAPLCFLCPQILSRCLRDPLLLWGCAGMQKYSMKTEQWRRGVVGGRCPGTRTGSS